MHQRGPPLVRPGQTHVNVTTGSVVDIVDNCEVKLTCEFSELIVVVDETLLTVEGICEIWVEG